MKLLFTHVPSPLLAETLPQCPFLPVLSFSCLFFLVNMFICFLYLFLLSFVNVLSYSLNCLVIFCLCPLCPITSSKMSSSDPVSSSFYNREECCDIMEPLLKTPNNHLTAFYLSKLSRPVTICWYRIVVYFVSYILCCVLLCNCI